MSRDYFSTGIQYPHLIELQPATHLQASTSAAPYVENAVPLSVPEPPRPRARHYAEYKAFTASAPAPAPPLAPALASAAALHSHEPCYGAGSAYEEDSEDAHFTRVPSGKKQHHSDIEKRRRDKMNTYISELAAMVPACSAMSRKLDKLTVLRLAVQHVRSVRGALAAGPLAACPRPPYVPERELNELVLAVGARTAVLVVGCERGRLLYVSHAAHAALQYAPHELLGQSLFDILHPKDVAKVKEQLCSQSLGPHERLVDANTMLPLHTEAPAATRLSSGARRSFICRIKCKAVTGEPLSKQRKYYAVHFTGYLKAWPAADEGTGSGEVTSTDEDEPAGPSCLVAVVRALAELVGEPPRPPAQPLRFQSRHAIDGKFLFVEQCVTLALGWLPQEMLGTSLYEYVADAQLAGVAHAHKEALTRCAPLHSPPYAARCKDGSTALLQTHFKPFRNPWTKDLESLMAQHTLLVDQAAPAPYHHPGEEVEGGASNAEVQRLIDSQVESHKIGSAIAEEALRRSPAPSAPDLPAGLLQDALCAGGETCGEAGVVAADSRASMALDGNGEAAMAVIMSLLEADAGLGGPVNFSNLPWPLP